MTFLRVDEAMELIQMEYAEMPDLALTFPQAKRLWNLSDELCDRALDALMKQGFLTRMQNGAFIRRNRGGVPA